MRSADGAALALAVDARAPEPLHVQLGRQLRAMILAGRIARGHRLPSSRTLAADLLISRATVVLALEQLASEGYLEGRRGAGMFVPAALPEQALQVEAPPEVPRGKSATSLESRAEPPRPFQIGATDVTLFTYKQWARLLYRTWRAPDARLVGGLDPFGWPELRCAIAQHLAEWRGIRAAPEQILVTSGTADAVEIIAEIAFRRGDMVAVEDPGYPTLRYALRRYGLRPAPIAVDEEGMRTAQLARLAHARGAIVTPSRQFPLGATLPLARRLELLEWAVGAGATLVEDDFDSEYRYEGAPLPALTSLDQAGRTVYFGSFSKVLSPTLRLGFIVLPERLVGAAAHHLRQRGVMASLVAQPVVAELIASGDYAKHIRRTRRIYARRMTTLVEKARPFSALLEVSPTPAGMHVVAGLSPAITRIMSDREAATLAREAKISAAPLADFYAGEPGRSALLLGFAGFHEKAIGDSMQRLGEVLERAANAGSKSARPEPAARSTRARGHTSAGGVTRRRAAPERARKPRPA